MERVQCAHCQGTGREVVSISLDTGQVTYRPCSVCGGSGSVGVERSHFTTYPDQSLRNAQSLMQVHGQPVQIQIVGNHDVRLLFADGARYILGGFTVGYRGTGPDYTERLLHAAGFDVSIDDIAAMEPPVTLVAGQPYLPLRRLVVEGETVEEARQRVHQQVPAGAEMVSVEVLREAPTLVTEEGEGDSQEAAAQQAKKSWVRDEWEVVEQKVLREAGSGEVIVQAHAADEAKKAAWQQLGREARLQKPVLLGLSERPTFDQANARVETISFEASSEAEALDAARRRLPAGAEIQRTTCARPPSKGFLGLGRSPGVYEVSWLLPWYKVPCSVPWKVALTYRKPAAVEVKFREPAA
jgi:hypothetical protein